MFSDAHPEIMAKISGEQQACAEMSRHTARDRSLKGGRGRPSARDGPRSRVRFDAEPIVHGAPNLLFAPKIALRRLDRASTRFGVFLGVRGLACGIGDGLLVRRPQHAAAFRIY